MIVPCSFGALNGAKAVLRETDNFKADDTLHSRPILIALFDCLTYYDACIVAKRWKSARFAYGGYESQIGMPS